MIKAQAKICGTISQGASVRQTKDGKTFLSVSVRLAIPGLRSDMPSRDTYIQVSVDADPSEAGIYVAGKRLEAEGVLTFKKRGDNLYLNFNAETVTLDADGEDKVSGTIDFKGTVGKDVAEKTTAKGKKFVSFSAFSTEKVGEEFAFTWVRFIKFDADKPAFLLPKSKIHATGVLELTAYNGNLSIGCRYDTVEESRGLPFSPQNPNEVVPY